MRFHNLSQRATPLMTRFKALDKNIRIATYVALGVCLWMLTGVFGCSADTDHSTKKTPLKSAYVRTISAQPFEEVVRLTGRSAPETAAHVAAQTAGKVEEILAPKGKVVKQGESLALLEMGSRESALQRAKARVKEASALYNAAKKLNKEGYKADTSLATREAELAAAEEALKQAQLDMSYRTVPSPISGRVERRHVDVGDYVAVGDSLFDVVNQDLLLLMGSVAQNDLTGLHAGAAAHATMANGMAVEGVVRFVASHADDTTKTYPVEVLIDGSLYPVPTGMTADIAIPTAQVDAFLIPHSALVLGDDGTLGTMIVVENIAHFYPLATLKDTPEGVWVKGLPNPAELVVRGQGALTHGEEVAVDYEDEQGE